MIRALPLLSLLLVLGPSLRAAAAPADPVRAEARERFDRGLRLFEEGDNAGALAEFRRVNELSPNRLVLFNIGMVYAAMNRPVEAAATLERVLKDPGPLASDRVAAARAALAQQQSRIGFLQVGSNTPAVIEVDGIEVGRTPSEAKIPVASGTHVVGALAAGHLPSRREVTVAGGATAELSFELGPTEASLAHIELSSPLPGADVFIDGARAGRTPLPTSLPVPAGTHVIELRRPGYQPARQELALAQGARGQLRLDLEEDGGAAAPRGTLRLQASEPEVTLSVDGRPRGVDPGRLALPAGPHRLRLERPGFETVEREVVVPAGGEASVRVTLVATPETRLAYVSRVRTRQRLGWASAAGGVALAIAGGAVAIWAHGDLPDARRELATVELDWVRMAGGACDHAMNLSNETMALCQQRLTDAENRIDSRKLWRTLGFVGAGVGLASAALGTYLLVSGEDVNRYDQPEATDPLAAAPRFIALPWLGPGTAGLGLRARF